MKKLQELITLTNTDINSGEKTIQLDVATTFDQFKELANDINYIAALDEFPEPYILDNKFSGARDTGGVKIEHFDDKLILQLLPKSRFAPKSRFTPKKIFLMANVTNGYISEYIDSDEYKGLYNDGLFKLHIATAKQVDELLSKYYAA